MFDYITKLVKVFKKLATKKRARTFHFHWFQKLFKIIKWLSFEIDKMKNRRWRFLAYVFHYDNIFIFNGPKGMTWNNWQNISKCFISMFISGMVFNLKKFLYDKIFIKAQFKGKEAQHHISVLFLLFLFSRLFLQESKIYKVKISPVWVWYNHRLRKVEKRNPFS